MLSSAALEKSALQIQNRQVGIDKNIEFWNPDWYVGEILMKSSHNVKQNLNPFLYAEMFKCHTLYVHICQSVR